MTSAIRSSLAVERAGLERDMAVAWTTAALSRSKKVPRLNAFLKRFRKRKRLAAVYAPAEVSADRAERLSVLTKGLTLSDTNPYERPPEEVDTDG